ncbi:MAG TPA: RdgB/HAM1 family non-canonical purine NTP pyrophosphatase [Puia sp.]|nr:RdgB/HAM1 family non-canonical purine NTP pyrophosphatase [Puia sp.]
MKLIFASNNLHKLQELRAAIGSNLEIISLKEAGIFQELPEPFPTLKENARSKARFVNTLTGGENCFSEDTGLEVDALGGEPGVHSARYAGDPPKPANNMRKLLRAMADLSNRRARFTTVICLILGDKEYFFEGRCEGQLLRSPAGDGGFGYDPIFRPEGSDKSFAEMSEEEKNLFSHRRKAGDLLIAFLRTQTETSNGQN